MTLPSASASSASSASPASSAAAGTLAGTLTGGFALLERAMGYTLGSLQLVTPDLMGAPTPCTGWTLRALLEHMNDSLRTLHEGIASGHVDLVEAADPGADYGDPATDPVGSLRNRACRMIGAWAAPGASTRISVGDARMPAGLVAATGAVEVSVHGWDVARSCGASRPLPPAFAVELLPLVGLLVDDADRPHRFAAAVEVRPTATASDQLLALLGRHPD
jgi:uncharacterized protein (TIGR03086 family)